MSLSRIGTILQSVIIFGFQWRLKALLKQLAATKISTVEPLKVLAVGCGTGVLRAQLESATDWTIDVTELDVGALSVVQPGRGRTLYYDICEEQNPASIMASATCRGTACRAFSPWLYETA